MPDESTSTVNWDLGIAYKYVCHKCMREMVGMGNFQVLMRL